MPDYGTYAQIIATLLVAYSFASNFFAKVHPISVKAVLATTAYGVILGSGVAVLFIDCGKIAAGPSADPDLGYVNALTIFAMALGITVNIIVGKFSNGGK